MITADNAYICVCTYRRPGPLGELLDSLGAQELGPAGESDALSERELPRLIVVDNSPEGDAEAQVRSQYPGAHYIHQPRPGIAAARNAAVEAVPSDAEAVLFLDDDERAAPDWLRTMIDCANDSGADTVSGPVITHFGEDPPEWLQASGFIRRIDFPTGPWGLRAATNNVLVRAHWFTSAGYRFDEAFSFIGGEDSDLFGRMQAAGARSWWCAEAQVEEDLPAERLSPAWMRQRGIRAGHVRATKLIRRAERDRPTPVLRIRIAAEGIGRLGYGVARTAVRRVTRAPVRYVDSVYHREGLGMLQAAAGRRYEEYGR
ncbi:glycosyltransferase family 2 protein [Nesterenkonia sandarakina]|uniref:Succinoglycan biosynthesis protein ExoM n=1 Tax=Nesterenkonia sandarakina TaxID=272918 RepID=A0A2T0YEW5_9MICC|nr:glycosyltransferase [Nesterenkonia sandarakina]PRZ13433.1 succinoglycan biosynthesis protein ExoM [Nesterenkonia sandarakina]